MAQMHRDSQFAQALTVSPPLPMWLKCESVVKICENKIKWIVFSCFLYTFDCLASTLCLDKFRLLLAMQKSSDVLRVESLASRCVRDICDGLEKSQQFSFVLSFVFFCFCHLPIATIMFYYVLSCFHILPTACHYSLAEVSSCFQENQETSSPRCCSFPSWSPTTFDQALWCRSRSLAKARQS